MMAYGPWNVHLHDVQYVSLISACDLYKNQFTEIKKKKKHVHVQRSIFLAQPYCVIVHIHIRTQLLTGADIYIHYTRLKKT